jgi:hypothetical protein
MNWFHPLASNNVVSLKNSIEELALCPFCTIEEYVFGSCCTRTGFRSMLYYSRIGFGPVYPF